MQRSRLTACAFPLLAHGLPIPLQRFPHWFPILRRRFHDYFLDLLLEQPCSQRAQLFGVATKHPPFKPELTVNFHVRYDYGEHLLVDIDSGYSVGHQLPPGRERRTCCGYLKQGRGLSPLPQGKTTTPNYSLKHARSGSDSVTASTSPLSSRPRRSRRLRS